MTQKKTYKLVLHSKALKEIENLPDQLRGKAKGIIDNLAQEPLPPQASKLSGTSNAYRIRLGDYRILYEIHATEIVIYVIGVGHRKEVYRKILRRIK